MHTLRCNMTVSHKDFTDGPSLNGNSKQRRQQRRKFERAVNELAQQAYA